MSYQENWTGEQALNVLLAENYRSYAQQEQVRAEALPSVEQIRELLHVGADGDGWDDDFPHDGYQAWLDEQEEAARQAHDAWLEELYAAEELERLERERDEQRTDH